MKYKSTRSGGFQLPLHVICREKCDSDFANILFELSDDEKYHPVRIDALDEFCRTRPLHLALLHKNAEMMEWLLRKGADANLPGSNEATPETLAYSDYLNFADSPHWWKFSKNDTDSCVMHACETVSRGFFLRWALDPLRELIKYRLPIEVCEMIVRKLENRDLIKKDSD